MIAKSNLSKVVLSCWALIAVLSFGSKKRKSSLRPRGRSSAAKAAVAAAAAGFDEEMDLCNPDPASFGLTDPGTEREKIDATKVKISDVVALVTETGEAMEISVEPKIPDDSEVYADYAEYRICDGAAQCVR